MRRFLIFLFLVACASAAADDRTNGLTQFSGALERLAGYRRAGRRAGAGFGLVRFGASQR